MSQEKWHISSFSGASIELSSPDTNVFHRFLQQVFDHPNKISVILEDQSITYSELYYLVNSVGCRLSEIVKSGDIVCQCVQRSIEMVVGILSILMCNTIYCPISPYDSEQRHRTLINETKAKVILVHNSTTHLFNNIDQIHLIEIDQENSFVLERIVTNSCDIAFIVFTSGSTGIPKGVPIGHENLSYYLDSMCYEKYIGQNDILLQISRDTFDAHLQEILGSVLIGGTCVLIRPTNGTHLNISYLMKIMVDHHVTFMNVVPSLSIAFLDYLNNRKELFSPFLRIVISTGEALPRTLANDLLGCLSSNTHLLNTYGVTETTVDCTYRRVFHSDTLPSVSSAFVPIGLPLPNYVCHVIFEEEEEDQIGELYIGGTGVFQGYLNSSTNPADSRLMEIKGKMCYRTGDLVKIVNDELVYVGRRDFQVKILGQRIETGEIEGILLREFRGELNGCIVMARNDRLISFVQMREKDSTIEERIKEICHQYLPSNISLSSVVVLDQFPLNANGKIDRNRLPFPELKFSSVSLNTKPETEIEKEIEMYWCQLLKIDEISCDINLLRLGVHSLHLMLATNYYCRQWLSDQSHLDLSIFFRETTISQHAQFIEIHLKTNSNLSECLPIHLSEGIVGPASFAQESIWIDQQIRFDEKEDMYEMMYVFGVSSNLLVSRLRSSVKLVVEKHSSLRSSLTMSNELIQEIHPLNNLDEYFHESWINTIDEETTRFTLDITKGRVFHCHLIHHSDPQSSDIVLFKFHHLMFDGTSERLFFNDLREAYRTGNLEMIENGRLSYVDYARWERNIDMSKDLLFWKENLKDCQCFELPFDRHLPTKLRSGRGSTLILQDLSGDRLIDYAAQQGMTLFQVCLSIYYVFLFKLTGQEDFIIGGLFSNRMNKGFDSIIGMFVNLIPYRLEIQGKESFRELLKRVQHLSHLVLSHAQLPFQSISKLIDGDDPICTIVDIEIIEDEYFLDDDLRLIEIDIPVKVTQFDLSLLFRYNPLKKMISCSFEYSMDVFDRSTIEIFGKRLNHLMKQILENDDRLVCEYNLLLEDEEEILRHFNPTNPIGQQTDCIHWSFIRQADKYPQKISIIMEDQSLSYAETLHYSQQISLFILKNNPIEIGDVICQLVQRSIEMVLGIIAIWMCGAIYTPFSPKEPLARLESRLLHLKARLLFVHQSTNYFKDFFSNITSIDLDQMNDQDNDLSILDHIEITCEDLSHIVFTSGSTGEPKMVELRHRGFVSYIKSCLIESRDIVIQHASVAFDSHIEEIMGPLILGGELVLLKPDPYHLDLDYFTSSIGRHQVTFLFPVPTLLIMLTNFLRTLPKDEQSTRLKSLRFVSCGGEKLYLSSVIDIVPFLNEECRVHNYYGPAECTLANLHYEVRGDEEENNIGLPIGRPMNNSRVFIVDQYFEKVLPGQIGEILIGGDGVFAGYRNEEELTRRVLIEHDGYQCYRTGDLGRVNPLNKQIEYLGRRDHQIKIRGQRIELDEIEDTIIRSSPHISNCIVIKITNQSIDHLVAYVQINDSIHEDQIRNNCIEHLSPFMIPSYFILLDKFPMNQSGKVDRSQLPLPNLINSSRETNVPLTSMEERLYPIVVKAFDLSDEFVKDVHLRFNQLGSTSLNLVKLLQLIRQEKLTGSSPVDINLLIDNPSIQQLAQRLQSLYSSHKSPMKRINNSKKLVKRSIVIETLSIIALIYIYVFPIYLSIRISFILAPLLHLFVYIFLKKCLQFALNDEYHLMYSSVYYRWWFLQRLWKLNSPWHGMLFGTSLYNVYLRLCGAKIGKNVQLRTNLIDWPDLIHIGENCFIGEDVVFKSMEYLNDNSFRLNSIQNIGKNCSIGARSVLHLEVNIDNEVMIKPLTLINHSFVGGFKRTTLNNDRPINVYLSIIGLICVWIIHECLLSMSMWLGRCFVPLVCLYWLIGCVCVTMISFKWFLSKGECWWIRNLIVVAFGFSIPLIFDGPDPEVSEKTYPRIVRWINRNRFGQNLRVAVVRDLLLMRRDSVHIGCNVTLGGNILFNDDEHHSIRIEDGASLGNDCIVEAGAVIPRSASVGSVTRVDLLPRFEQENQVILGIPARPISVLFSQNADIGQSSSSSNFILRSIFIRMMILLFTVGTIDLKILPLWIFIFGSIVSVLYSPEEDSSLVSCFGVTLLNDFRLLVGPFLGGTQWLNIYLNALGAKIDSTAMISDIDCIDDPQLISIGSHVYIDQCARVQGHTNEHRQWYMNPVSIGCHCYVMPHALILPGCDLKGNNVIYPCTLIMKGDTLEMNTDWEGSPCKSLN